MTTEVDYNSEICECGELLHFDPMHPDKRPNHLCGEAAMQVAFAIWIRYRVKVLGTPRTYWSSRRPQRDDAAEFEKKARAEAEKLLDLCGIGKTYSIPAELVSLKYTDDEAWRLNEAHHQLEAITKHHPKIGEVLKEYFIDREKQLEHLDSMHDAASLNGEVPRNRYR